MNNLSYKIKKRLKFDFKTSNNEIVSECIRALQETYAMYDLKEFHCDEAIGILLQTYTPQEVLRTIRHSTRGNLRNEDIQSFINSWASSIMQRTDELESMLSENGIGKEEGVKHGK